MSFDAKTFLSLGLFEMIEDDTESKIIRVPGGYIYKWPASVFVFVPFDFNGKTEDQL